MNISELQNKVNEYISQLPYDRKPASLYEPIRYTLAAGGKRLRPVLMLLTYSLYKSDPESILKVAAGVETYHNYTLLHDDFIDNADKRRGRDTVHRIWGAGTTILSSEAMVVQAFQYASACPDDKFRPVFEVMSETALQIAEGQQYDMEFEERDDVTEAEYLEMIRLKTSVLLGCAVKIGAILGDASPEDQDNLYRFAMSFGLAFQLQDDYLDVYGDEKVFGKEIGGDICNNKKTFMFINAQQLAEGEQKAELERWISTKDFDREEKVRAVTEIYNKVGVDRLAKQRMDEYYAEAMRCLDAVSVAEEKKTALREYVEGMIHRNS